MKSITKLTLTSMVAFMVFSSPLVADANKGRITFLKKYKKDCNMKTGTKFTRIHTQDQWENIFGAGNFENEFYKLCPNVKKGTITKDEVPHLYDFAYDFASDSGNIPSCSN